MEMGKVPDSEGLSVIWNIVFAECRTAWLVQSTERTEANRSIGLGPTRVLALQAVTAAVCQGQGEPVGKERDSLLGLHALVFLLRSGGEKRTLLRRGRPGHHGAVQVGGSRVGAAPGPESPRRLVAAGALATWGGRGRSARRNTGLWTSGQLPRSTSWGAQL